MTKRLLWALVFVGTCGGWVVLTLTGLASREVTRSPIVSEQSGWPALPVALQEADASAGRHAYTIALIATSLADLVSHDEIRIRLATYHALRVTQARLLVSGTRCLYEAAPGAALPVNDELRLVRGRSCVPQESVSTGDLDLLIELAERYPVAIWTLVPPTELPQPGFMFVSRASTTQPNSRPLVRGTYVDYAPASSFRRLFLLNYAWGLAPTSGWIWIVLTIAAVLVVMGGLMMPDATLASSVRSISSVAIAYFCFAAALGLTYSVLVPPFEAPDEPDHLLSYATITNRPELVTQAVDLAKRGHLERIKFRGNERLRPIDVDRPLRVPWGEHVEAEDLRAKSSTAFVLWSMVAAWLRDASAARTLLSIRVINSVIFALAIAFGTALVIGLAPPLRYPHVIGFIYLFVPALPFFAMHMSVHAFLTSAYVLLSCSLLTLFLDGRRAHVIGLPLGLSLALTLASGRSALPMMGLVLCVLMGRIVLGSAGSTGEGWIARVKAAVVFWGGFALGAACFHLIATAAYRADLWALAAPLLGPGMRGAVEYLANHEWLLLAAAALAASLEAGMAGIATRSPIPDPRSPIPDPRSPLPAPRSPKREGRGARVGRLVVRAIAFGGAAAVTLVMLGSLVRTYPMLPSIEAPSPRPSASEYVLDVLRSVATMLRFGNPDLLLFSSFWTGFGWIDTIPSAVLLSGLAVATALSFIGLLVHLGRVGDVRRIVWMVVMAGGWTTSLALYALSARATVRNVQGRYLIGLYLAMLAVMWITPAMLTRSNGGTKRPRVLRRPVAFFALCAAIHAYCLSFILSRYF